MKWTKRSVGLVAGAALVALAGAPADAHVSPDKSEVPAGGYTAVTLTVGHGCEGSPTTSVVVQVPPAINDVTPQVLPGWDIDVATEALAEPVVDAHGTELTERESEVTFTARSGEALPDGFRLGFTLGFKAPDTPGESLFFKTIQVCEEGQTDWIAEYTGEGEEPDNPSPVVAVVAGDGDGHGEEATDDAHESADETADEADDEDSEGAGKGLALIAIAMAAVGIGIGAASLRSSRRA